MLSWVLVVLVVLNFHDDVTCLNNQGYALISFKQSIYEDPEGSLSNWNSSDDNPCSWNGVTCKEQRVVSVSIPKKKLYGFLPSSLGFLSDLRHVNLRNNKFFGTLPVELLEAQGLQSLVLYGNSLSGSLPKDIGKLKYLQTLALSDNFFNGSLPSSIVQCKRLKTLDLSRNNFTKAGMASFTPLSWSVRLKIIKCVAKGLVYLHEFSPKKYVHGDLKPSNILLDQNMEAHISDFGLGRLANIAGGSPTTQSNRILSDKPLERLQKTPEALKVVKPSQKWDVYSYGVILLEMITGRSPVVHVGTSEMDLVNWIQLCIEEKKPLSDVLDPYLAPDADKEEEIIAVLKITMACVHSSPERRPTMRHVLDALDRRSPELTIAYAFHTLGPAEYNYNVDALTDDEVIQVGNEWQLADVG
ncbi:hypothetical protein GOBAR_DD33995 [Gossypium barbadense]|nr:hypothetical protein GOBAR_DD33995 [Gossypium barbadense]